MMEEQQLRISFIGGSVDSAVGNAHFAACQMDARWRLVAGCFSNDGDENRRSAVHYSIPQNRLYDDWRNLILKEKENIDAVAILTPTTSHSEFVQFCLNEQIPVICEKAMAPTVEEAESIRAKRIEVNGFLAVTYNYSGYPMVRELRNKIALGELGRIVHFQAEMPQEGFIRVDSKGNPPAPQAWRLEDGEIPTIHLDLGVHLHQLLYYLMDVRPREVIADQCSAGWFEQVVDQVSALCHYDKGIRGQIWFSKSALGYRNGLRLRIFGTEASAEWTQTNPEELIINHKNGRREILDRASAVSVADGRRYGRFKAGHPAGFIEAFANLYCDIADSLHQFRRSGQWISPEVFSDDIALEGLRFMEAMASSARTRSWTSIP